MANAASVEYPYMGYLQEKWDHWTPGQEYHLESLELISWRLWSPNNVFYYNSEQKDKMSRNFNYT
jgi:hypothetical protein